MGGFKCGNCPMVFWHVYSCSARRELKIDIGFTCGSGGWMVPRPLCRSKAGRCVDCVCCCLGRDPTKRKHGGARRAAALPKPPCWRFPKMLDAKISDSGQRQLSGMPKGMSFPGGWHLDYSVFSDEIYIDQLLTFSSVRILGEIIHFITCALETPTVVRPKICTLLMWNTC